MKILDISQEQKLLGNASRLIDMNAWIVFGCRFCETCRQLNELKWKPELFDLIKCWLNRISVGYWSFCWRTILERWGALNCACSSLLIPPLISMIVLSAWTYWSGAFIVTGVGGFFSSWMHGSELLNSSKLVNGCNTETMSPLTRCFF